MADEAGFEIAKAYVTVDPDAGDFDEQLKAQIGDPSATVTVDADTAPADASVDSLSAKLDDLEAKAGDVTVGADTGEASAALDLITEKLEKLEATAAQIAVFVDDEEAESVLAGLQTELDELQAWHGEITVGLDDEGAQEQLGFLSAAIDDLQSEMDDLAAGADAAGGSISALASQTGELAGVASAAADRLNAAGDEIDALGGEAAGASPEVDELAASLAAAAAASDGVNDSAGKAHPIIASLVGAVIGLGPAFIGAAAGALLFAGAAIPAIEDIMHDTGPFRDSLAAIRGEYNQLADAVKPEVFADFDDALNQARAILPEFTAAAQAGGAGVGDLINQLGAFGSGGDTQAFLNFVSGATAEDMHAFGNLLQGGATAVYGFAESLNGISTVLVNIAGGILSFGGTVLETVPWLGQFGVAIGGAYLAAEKLPPILNSIATSNFFQWITGSEQGLLGLGAAFTAAAAGGAAVSPEMAALAAETAAITTETAALEAEVAGLVAELAAVDPELVGLDAGLAALDAEMAAAAAEGGVLAGVFGVLAAINPLVWVAAAAVALGALVAALIRTSDAQEPLIDNSNALIASMARQDDATGDNVAGYQKLSEQLSGVSGHQIALRSSTDDMSVAYARFGAGLSPVQQAAEQVTAAQKQAAEEAQRFGEQVDAVASRLGLAEGPAEAIATDMNIIGNNADTAKQKVAAFNNEIATLTGTANTLWQAQLNVAAGFNSITADATATGATMLGTNQASITLQQAFATQIATLDTYGQKQETAGTLTQGTSDYLTEQTAKLALLTGGNKTAITQVEGMIKQEQLWGAKTGLVNTAITNLSKSIDGAMISSLKSMGINSQSTDTQIDKLTGSILKTGTTSASTAGDRAALIKDLENAGLDAQKSAKFVQQLIDQIADLHSKTVTITVNAAGTAGSVIEPGGGGTVYTKTPGGGYAGRAAGGYITGPGTPTSDSIPTWLSEGEYVEQASAVRKYGRPFMDAINSGDLADAISGASGGSQPVNVNFYGTQYPTPEQVAALKMELASAVGVSG